MGQMGRCILLNSTPAPISPPLICYVFIMLVNQQTLKGSALLPQKSFGCDGLPSAVLLHHCSVAGKLAEKLVQN